MDLNRFQLHGNLTRDPELNQSGPVPFVLMDLANEHGLTRMGTCKSGPRTFV
jgi:hypothetical protein